MESSYHGIFSHKLRDGTITAVQVEDTFGMGLSLPIYEYRQRGIQPPAESLPDQNEFKSNTSRK